MTTPVSDQLARFLRTTVFPAIAGTKRASGSVQLNPAWYEFRDGSFWLNTRPGTRWLAHIERDRQATLLLVDPANPSQTAHAQTRLIRTTPDNGLKHAGALSRRYTGKPYQGPPGPRIIIQLEPTKITYSIGIRPHHNPSTPSN